jgi:uncharacterized membrane protein SpoIIM required for sporulation
MVLGFTESYGASLIGEQLVPFMLLIVGFFPMSFSLVIALETFVGEKERKSLEPLLATPVTNTQLYVGKMLAAIMPPLATSYLGILVYTIGLIVAVGWVISAELFVQILILSTIQGLLMVAAAVVVSSQTNTVRSANLLASFIIVPVALLVQFEAIALFWGNKSGLWWLILAMLVATFMLIRMGIKIFNREDLLGQDIDQIKLGWIWYSVWQRFSGKEDAGRYPNPIQWYKSLFGILPEFKKPVITLLLGLIGGLILGYVLTLIYPVSQEISSSISGADIVANTTSLQYFFADLPMTIFMQNLRVIAVAVILGIFTFGVMDVVIYALPWTIIGIIGGLLVAAGEQSLQFIVAAILPHAIFEVAGLTLALAAALRWHASVLERPEDKTVGQSWLNGVADFGRVMVGLAIPLLFIAAYVEAYITPKVILAVYGG